MHAHRSRWITALAVSFAVALAELPVVGAGREPVAQRRGGARGRLYWPPCAWAVAHFSIVIGGLMFAFGEGGSKKALAGIIFGLGMAMGAANFLTWLFT